MANITVICPNCGAKISVEETKNASTCCRCGTSYFLREAKRVTEIAEEPKKEEKAPKKAAPKKKSAPKKKPVSEKPKQEAPVIEETPVVEEVPTVEETSAAEEEPAQPSEEEIQAKRRADGLCPYCGGKFGGLFVKKCKTCGRKKDY